MVSTMTIITFIGAGVAFILIVLNAFQAGYLHEKIKLLSTKPGSENKQIETPTSTVRRIKLMDGFSYFFNCAFLLIALLSMITLHDISASLKKNPTDHKSTEKMDEKNV